MGTSHNREYGEEEGGVVFKRCERRIWSGGVESHRKRMVGIKGRSPFSIGNGRRFKFCKDLWCEDLTLEQAFPNLFSFASNEDGW